MTARPPPWNGHVSLFSAYVCECVCVCFVPGRSSSTMPRKIELTWRMWNILTPSINAPIMSSTREGWWGKATTEAACLSIDWQLQLAKKPYNSSSPRQLSQRSQLARRTEWHAKCSQNELHALQHVSTHFIKHNANSSRQQQLRLWPALASTSSASTACPHVSNASSRVAQTARKSAAKLVCPLASC